MNYLLLAYYSQKGFLNIPNYAILYNRSCPTIFRKSKMFCLGSIDFLNITWQDSGILGSPILGNNLVQN